MSLQQQAGALAQAQIGLIDWLKMADRPVRGFLPARYVSIAELFARYCVHRASCARPTPWDQEKFETELRRALVNGELVGWQILGSRRPRKVESTAWNENFVWHRAMTGEDMASPEFDGDGDHVPEHEWRERMRDAGAAGLYVVEVENALQWLGFGEPVNTSAADRDREARNALIEALVIALRAHFAFDKANAPWVKAELVLEEVKQILRSHGLKEFLRDAKALAAAIRPEGHKAPMPPSLERRRAMDTWPAEMEAKRSKFTFPCGDGSRTD